MVILHIIFNVFIVLLLRFFLIQQIDARLKHEMEHISDAFIVGNDSLIVVNKKELSERDLIENTDQSYFLQVYDFEGNIYYKSKSIPGSLIIPPNVKVFTELYSFENISIGDLNLRTCYYIIIDKNGSKNFLIQLSVQDKLFSHIVFKIILFNIFTFPIVVIMVIFLSLILVRDAFKPVKMFIQIANKISATNLKERININTEADFELDMLKETLNSLFERLEEQIDRISHFTDNASHQLMTPLTAMQSELDYILRKDRSREEYLESIKNLKDQTTRLINITKSMLLLAKEENLAKHSVNVFNLTNLITKEILPQYRESANVSFFYGDNIYCRGNAEYVALVFYNLIDNAIKYSPDNTPVKVSVENENECVKIVVSDVGMGISEEDKEKIFERFFRSRQTDKLGLKGYGLGLSLVKKIVDSLSGRIEVKSEINKGAEFIVYLPGINIEE